MFQSHEAHLTVIERCATELTQEQSPRCPQGRTAHQPTTPVEVRASKQTFSTVKILNEEQLNSVHDH